MSLTSIESLYDAFAKGDVPFVLGLLSPDIVWTAAENYPYADRSPYVGPQELLEGLFLRLATEWDGFSATPQEHVAAGDTVVTFGRYQGVYTATGIHVDAQFVHVWKFSDGKVKSFQQYCDTAQFRDAVTLVRPASV